MIETQSRFCGSVDASVPCPNSGKTSSPSRRYVPAVGVSRQPRIFNSEDLPDPDAPRTVTNSPRPNRNRHIPQRDHRRSITAVVSLLNMFDFDHVMYPLAAITDARQRPYQHPISRSDAPAYFGEARITGTNNHGAPGQLAVLFYVHEPLEAITLYRLGR